MAKRSPIRSNVKFALPIRGVVSSFGGFSGAEDDVGQVVPLPGVSAGVGVNTFHGGDAQGPMLQLQRFYSFGTSRERPGTHHSVLLCKRPVLNEFTLDQEFKISGYCGYSYLRNGSMVAGLVFHTDKTRTVCNPMRLVIRGTTQNPTNFVTSYNLEKLGVLSFVADDSTTLLIPTEVDSSLVIKVD